MTALDAGARRVLELIRESGRPPLESLSPEAARAASAASRPVLQPEPPPVPEWRDIAGPVPLRLYRAAAGVRPCLLYLHGGGWVIGDLDSHDQLCRELALLLDAVVVAVDYRLAPEHPFPAAVEDCAAALRFVTEQAEALGIDPTRIAVGGDSAGGNLATVLCLLARQGALPMPGFQMLLYPVTDMAEESPAYARFTEGYPLTAATMRWFIAHYAPQPAMRADWRASPARAESLSGLPPAFVMTAGHDPLADEGIAYARRLEAEGVPVSHLHVSDQMHACLTMGKFIPASALVLRQAAAALRQHWGD
ncbi:alpha/beta hydrolase [Rhodovarius lipocyclicus]|uniref:alpha/beta hydrolase n=1 Tax=Rhodovarius lipocyclicus TaxID=268410 RepID=UPI00135A9F5F|nr:alpha/beta hydrolase [Rhodovarius lipocyclicus]